MNITSHTDRRVAPPPRRQGWSWLSLCSWRRYASTALNA